MNFETPDWLGLTDKYGDAVVTHLRTKFETPGSFALTEESVSSRSNCSNEVARAILDDLARSRFLIVTERKRCPYCKKDLTEEQTEIPECVHCNVPFGSGSYNAQTYRIYTRTGDKSRDVKWVVTIHGMNTQGEWQEEYVWRLARLYGYSVPVAIYKYGNIKVSPFIPGRRTYFTHRLIKNIKRYSAESNLDGYGDRPDVIAHSFGTWLLYKALLVDREFKVGRVILAGSIIPPDFDWTDLIVSGQVEAVLCHHAARDIIVRLAQYGISDSGPSGYCGFNNRARVVHRLERDFHHSDFFLPANLPTVMETVWAPFLTAPKSVLPSLSDSASAPLSVLWSPSPWGYVTRPVKTVFLIFLFLSCVFIILSTYRGIIDTWKWIWT